MSNLSKNLLYDIENYYKLKTPKGKTEKGDYVQASVVVILNTDQEILFIKRTENPNDPYSGQMAFPGGKQNDEDRNAMSTAIREVKEEVGIDLERGAKIIGEIDPIKPLNPRGPNYIVTPFIAVLKKAEVPIVSEEVDQCIWIPLSHFLNPDNIRHRIKEVDGISKEDFVYEYGNYIIWGMTGKIVNSFINNVSVIL